MVVAWNINKKLLAGALACVLTTTSLVGCTTIKDFNYETDEQGYVTRLSSKITYSRINNDCKFIKVKNNITNEEYYTISIYLFNSVTWRHEDYDLFTSQNLSLGDFEKEYVGSVTAYLIAYKMVKDEYTEEELREVLNIFIENQEKDNSKQKVME